MADDPMPMRIARDRAAAHRQAVDGLDGPGLDAAARIALSIYDGGSMGSQPLLYYLGNPVVFNGEEEEGQPATPVVDATTSIPLVVLGKAPAVGDILLAVQAGGRWVAEKSSGAGICCCVWGCTSGDPPDSWSVYDPYFDQTIALPKVDCDDDCADASGAQVYCLWRGTATVDFPGSVQCPAFAGIVVTYTIGCYSYADGYVNFFWVECGWNGTVAGCSNPWLSFIVCPGNTYPITGDSNQPVLDFFYPCVVNPSSATVTNHGTGGSFGFFYGPAWVLYGMTCNNTTDYSFTLTPSTSSQDCAIPCSPCAIPNEDLTVSWTNAMLGDGSATMTFDGNNQTWLSACSGPLMQNAFKLTCNAGSADFLAYAYADPACSGSVAQNGNLLSAPHKLVLASSACGAGFALNFTVDATDCPSLFAQGFTAFAVTL